MPEKMPHTPEAEAEEQQSNKHLQGDHHKGAQRVGHGVPQGDREGKAGPAPEDEQGGRQQGGSRGR